MKEVYFDNFKIGDFLSLSSYFEFNNHVFSQDMMGDCWIYDAKSQTFEPDKNRYYYPISESLIGLQVVEEEFCLEEILDDTLTSVFSCKVNKSGWLHKMNENYMSMRVGFKKIQTFSFVSQSLQWEYELSDFGTFINHWRDEEQYEIKRIIGFWQNQLLVACSNSLIIVLDAHTGELLHTWQEKKGTFSKINIGFADKIPHAEHFVLDPNANKLIACSIFSYFEIDLITKEITVIELEEELRQYKIADVSGGHGETPLTDTHLIARVSLESRPNDDRMYDGLIALNRNTHKVDWFYPFEEVAISVQKPKLVGNKLYQMDMGGTLHIFEREENF